MYNVSYIDDILVIGANDDEHFHNLEEVLVHLNNHGIWVKSSKCTFSNLHGVLGTQDH